jgi:hypothetical protein
MLFTTSFTFLPILRPLPHQSCERSYLTPDYFQSSLQGSTAHSPWHCFVCFPLEFQGQGNHELVIHRDVSEKVSHGLSIVDSPNCFRKNQTDIHSLYLGTLQLLDLMRDSICHHHLVVKQYKINTVSGAHPKMVPQKRMSNI